MASLVQILIADAPASEMRSVPAVRAVEGRGLQGDRYFFGTGTFSPKEPKPDFEVTLIELEKIESFAHDFKRAFTAHHARRNLVTEGVSLNALVGREFFIGPVKLRGIRLCEPCRYLAKKTHSSVLKGLVQKGGLRAAIAVGGILRLGDSIRSEQPSWIA